MNISESVILITAAGSPLGKAISLHFASLGASLALVDTHNKALQQTLRACQAIGSQCQSYLITSQDEHSVASMINNVHHRYGKIDVLVNCWLGMKMPPLLGPEAVDQFRHTMNEAATPFFIFGKHAAQYMRDHHHPGVIINLATHNDSEQYAINAGCKAMITGLTQSWAKELAAFNIRVGGVVPLTIDQGEQPIAAAGQPMQYEIVRSAEYIVANDYFNGRMIEAEVI